MGLSLVCVLHYFCCRGTMAREGEEDETTKRCTHTFYGGRIYWISPVKIIISINRDADDLYACTEIWGLFSRVSCVRHTWRRGSISSTTVNLVKLCGTAADFKHWPQKASADEEEELNDDARRDPLSRPRYQDTVNVLLGRWSPLSADSYDRQFGT